jgi:hypothetical protein
MIEIRLRVLEEFITDLAEEPSLFLFGGVMSYFFTFPNQLVKS